MCVRGRAAAAGRLLLSAQILARLPAGADRPASGNTWRRTDLSEFQAHGLRAHGFSGKRVWTPTAGCAWIKVAENNDLVDRTTPNIVPSSVFGIVSPDGKNLAWTPSLCLRRSIHQVVNLSHFEAADAGKARVRTALRHGGGKGHQPQCGAKLRGRTIMRAGEVGLGACGCP